MIADSVQFWPAHWTNVSHYPYEKTVREWQSAMLRCGHDSFAVASSGHPISWSTGKQVRRMTGEDLAAHLELSAQIKALREQMNELHKAAWKRGELARVAADPRQYAR